MVNCEPAQPRGMILSGEVIPCCCRRACLVLSQCLRCCAAPAPHGWMHQLAGLRLGQQLLHPVSSDFKMFLSENQCYTETCRCSKPSDYQMPSLLLSILYKCNENLMQRKTMGKFFFRFPEHGGEEACMLCGLGTRDPPLVPLS